MNPDPARSTNTPACVSWCWRRSMKANQSLVIRRKLNNCNIDDGRHVKIPWAQRCRVRGKIHPNFRSFHFLRDVVTPKVKRLLLLVKKIISSAGNLAKESWPALPLKIQIVESLIGQRSNSRRLLIFGLANWRDSIELVNICARIISANTAEISSMLDEECRLLVEDVEEMPLCN